MTRYLTVHSDVIPTSKLLDHTGQGRGHDIILRHSMVRLMYSPEVAVRSRCIPHHTTHCRSVGRLADHPHENICNCICINQPLGAFYHH